MPTPLPASASGSALSTVARTLLVPFVVATLLVLGLPASASAHTSSASTVAAKVSSKVSSKVTTKAIRAKKVARLLDVAKDQRGDRYRYGATGPSAFDCSGLVLYATRMAGFKGVPRTSSAQSNHMTRISRKHMRPGDFVFFHSRGRVYHVGIYSGLDRTGRPLIVHAPGTGKRVRTERIWTNSYFVGSLRV